MVFVGVLAVSGHQFIAQHTDMQVVMTRLLREDTNFFLTRMTEQWAEYSVH